MRIFAISDLHVDFSENFKWVVKLSQSDYQNDVLLIAGDVTHDLELLEKTLMLLKRRFMEVFFVPGNHELWLKNNLFKNSLEKFWAVMHVCESCEVHTNSLTLKDEINITIFPILSWYTLSTEGDDSLYWPKEGEDLDLSMWSDTHLVNWPSDIKASEFFLSLSDKQQNISLTPSNLTISFSHFLPRQELMYVYGQKIHTDRSPEFNFSSVAGSSKIDTLLRNIGSSLHLYGHHHRNQIQNIQGVTYISCCLGYPFEHYCRKQWDFEHQGPVKIYDRGKLIKP